MINAILSRLIAGDAPDTLRDDYALPSSTVTLLRRLAPGHREGRRAERKAIKRAVTREISRSYDNEHGHMAPALDSCKWQDGHGQSTLRGEGYCLATVSGDTLGRSWTWSTWDKHGTGGENAIDPSLDVAKREVVQALIRQGWVRVDQPQPTTGGEPTQHPLDAEACALPSAEECDCQNPEPGEGVAGISLYCPVHNLYPRPTEKQDEPQPTTGGEDA